MTGADSNPGTLAQPFGTIQQAADVAQPGDTIYIRGGTYRETVIPARSGTAAAPIFYQNYNGESVTIDGADPISGWSAYQGAVAQVPLPWDLGDGNNQVFVDGVMIDEARSPSAGPDPFHPLTATADTLTTAANPNGPYLNTETATLNSSSLTDPAGTWNGATIHIASGEGWAWQTGTIIDYQPGQLTYQYTQLNTRYQVPRAGNPFYITGSLHALNSAGQWYRDPSTGTLYLWDPQGDSPAYHLVEVKHRLYGFELSGRSYITVRGLSLFASSIDTDAASTGVLLSNLDVKYVSQETINSNPFAAKTEPPTTGILLNGTHNVLEDSTIAFSAGNGVALAGSDNVVQNCFIHDIDTSGFDFAGIDITGPNDQALNNTIRNLGRNGITQYFAANDNVLNNLVHDFGLLTTDCGGIYTWTTDGAGSEWAYNIIYNGRGAGFGNTGIFLDNSDSNFLIHHNLVYNADNALKLSPPSHDDQVYNNTFVGVTFGLGGGYPPDMAGSIVENNIFVGTVWWGPGVVQQHNLLSGAPGFINAAGGDYQLATGSPAIDAGMLIPPYTNGYHGSAPDDGAFELGEAPFASGATAVPPPLFTPPPTSQPPPNTPPPGGNPPPSPPQSQSAFATILAGSFSTGSAVQQGADGSITAGPGDWLRFADIDFAAGAKLLRLHLAIPGPLQGMQIQFRLDSPTGPLLGTLRARAGKHGMPYRMLTARARRLAGTHDLYVLLIGGAGRITFDALTFTPAPQPRSHPHRLGLH